MTATWSCQCLGSRCWLPSGSGADSAWRSPWTHGLWAPNLPGLVLQGGGAGERDLAKDGCIQLSVWHTSRNSRRHCPLVLSSSPRPVVSWELSQAGLVSSDESGNSGLCPAGLSGTLPPTPGVGPASAPPSWRQLQQGLRPRPLGPCVALPEAGIHVFFGAVLLRKRPFYSQETRQDEFLSPTYHLQIESRRRRRVLAGQGPAGSFPGRLVTKPAPVTPRSKARPGILAFWFAV